MQGMGDLRFGPPTPPPSPVYKPKAAWGKLQVSLYNPKTLLAGSAAKRKQPRDAVQNPYLGHYYRQNLTKLQSRTDEIENFFRKFFRTAKNIYFFKIQSRNDMLFCASYCVLLLRCRQRATEIKELFYKAVMFKNNPVGHLNTLG